MVAFRDLWHGHPINNSVQNPCIAPRSLKNAEGTQVEPGFPTYTNQCAIRMGVALKRGGVLHTQVRGGQTCLAHPVDEMHFINATILANGIASANLAGFGPKEVYPAADVARYYDKLIGRTGVMFIKDYWSRPNEANPSGDHIDVWNGYRSSAKWLMEWFSWAGYYSNYSGANEIWFWPVD